MFDNDLEPKKKANGDFPRDLENISVDELEEYILELQAEITRVQGDIDKKQASKVAADAAFK